MGRCGTGPRGGCKRGAGWEGAGGTRLTAWDGSWHACCASTRRERCRRRDVVAAVDKTNFFHCYFKHNQDACFCTCSHHPACAARQGTTLRNKALLGNDWRGVDNRQECCNMCTNHPLCSIAATQVTRYRRIGASASIWRVRPHTSRTNALESSHSSRSLRSAQ